ncbi:hypothetical protein [Micromonospora haikouensis]|uniref:hypothetical protein n=1 Tax=Micromonospora haikouensis TaxID=686309 RepID=UPI003D71E055
MDKFVRIFTLPDGTQAAAGPFHYPAKADEFGIRIHAKGLAVDRGSLPLDTHAALERKLHAAGARFDPNTARCRVCGCTEDTACIGGCQWAPDVQQLAAGFDPTTGDLCTRCLAAAPAPEVRDAIRALCRAIRTGQPLDFEGRAVPVWLQDLAAAELAPVLAEKPAPLHITEVYRLPAGAGGWRCSCGEGSGSDITRSTASEQARLHRNDENRKHPALTWLADAVRAVYPAAATVTVTIDGPHVRLRALHDHDGTTIPPVESTTAAWGALCSAIATAYSEGVFGRGEGIAEVDLPAVTGAL